MSKVLSQEEVDALLKGMAGGGVDTEPEAVVQTNEYELFDFVNQSRVIKVKLPTFDAINDQFMRNFRVTMTTTLRRMVDIFSKPVEIVKFSDFAKNLPVPSSLHIFKMEPLRGSALFVIDSRLVFHLVECFLGGLGKAYTRVEGREFTPIEQRLIIRVVNLAFADLERVWHPIHQVKFQYLRSEINPQFARIVQPNDPVIISHFTVDMEEITGEISMCVPFVNIEPIKTKLAVSYQKEQEEGDIDPLWPQQLRAAVRRSMLELRVELGKTTMPAESVSKLKAGDVISLKKDLGDPLVVMVEGVKKFTGYPGLYKGNKAFQLFREIAAE
ncbi:MAG: flagellar motor switch protein FliM [Pseudomonadota bacterium]